MAKEQKHPLSPKDIKSSFIKELSILYSAKRHLITCLPKFVSQATFSNLKLALAEDLEETKMQLSSLRSIFQKMGQPAVTDDCLGMNAIIAEAEKQVNFSEDDFYSSDMSIIFYMNVIENLQIGACRVLHIISSKPDFLPYQQLVKESLDTNKDNARLFKAVAKEYYDA